MNEGFTGFNPTLAKVNIDNFKGEANSCLKSIEDTVLNFFNELQFYWASPKAVEFHNKYFPLLNDLAAMFDENISSIVIGAERAYNIAARANGASSISEDSGRVLQFDTLGSFDGGTTGITNSRGGVVGMNIEYVQNNIIPSLEVNVRNVVAKIDSLPTEIALYDDENGQRHAYSTGIRSFSDRFSSMMKSLISDILQSTTEEADNILLAREQAASTLNSNITA